MKVFLFIIFGLSLSITYVADALISSNHLPKMKKRQFSLDYDATPMNYQKQRNNGITAPKMVASGGASVEIAALRAIFKLLSTCGLGAVASRKGILDKTAISVLSKLVYNVFQPALLFVNVCSTVAQSGSDPAITILPIAAAFQIFVGFCVGKIVSGFLYGPKPTNDSKLLLTCNTFGNSGPLPFVFADALFRMHPDPTLAPKAVAYISLYLLGWSPLFWVVGTTILSKSTGGNQTEQLKLLQSRILSPPVVASIMGLIVGNIPFIRNLLIPTTALLNPAFEAIRTLGSAYLPAVLLVLAGSLVPPKPAPGDAPALPAAPGANLALFKKVVAVYGSRFLLMPTFGFLLVKIAKQKIPFLAKILTDPMLVFILLLETCMPSAQNSTVILSLNGDSKGASQMARILVLVYIAGIPAMSYWLAKIMKYTTLF